MINLDNVLKFITILGAVILFLFLFDTALASGLLMLTISIAITFFIIRRKISSDKFLFIALIITIIVHLVVVFFIYYANFQPFGEGGGDYIVYNSNAQYLSSEFRQGNFSSIFSGDYLLKYDNYYPVVIGLLYAVTTPQMIVGQLFNVWLAVVSVLLVYLLITEIGGTGVQAFFATIMVNLYPSYLFFASLLLKDTVIVPLAIASLFLIVKMVKKFLWRDFFIFYLIMVVLTHFRFYISYASVASFIFCWFIFSAVKIKKRIIYGIVIVFLLGFLPQISGYGYFGMKTFRSYFSKEEIVNYRQAVYVSKVQTPSVASPSLSNQSSSKGSGSSFTAKTDFNRPFYFIVNFSETYSYALMGPFPWQLKLKRQLFALIEVLPWYFLLFFIGKGIIKLMERYKVVMPLLLFSATVFAILGLYTPNFGIITRIRMPAFIILFCLAPFGFSKLFFYKMENLINKINNKF